MEELVAVEKLEKRFGPITAVDGVSFSLRRGEVLGFLGPNGSGKSTTMRMITGFLPPSAGKVRVCGIDVVEHPVRVKQRIGYLPEGAPLYSDMTPASVLDFVADVRGMDAAKRKRRTGEIVEKLHIGHVLHQPIETLSKGYKRRVGLAQAILHDPDVLVLDEPTDGLDPNQKHEVRTLLAEMASEKAIIISTHILEEVDAVCTRAIIIARGRILVDETPARLRARSPRHNAVAVTVTSAAAAEVSQLLAGIASVRTVETAPDGDGRTRLLAVPRHGEVVLGEVRTLVRSRSIEADVQLEVGELDAVFRELTTAA